ncbi:MAG: response regulator [Bacteroidales bacterium]|nr:response regulator [Bacteroidales bacterium]
MKVNGYNVRQISNKDGLSNSAILSVCQDQEGFMWFGSCDGLNMYDGSSIRVYKPSNNKNDLSGNLIHTITETENGIFWITTNYGLNRFNKRKNTVDHFEGFAGNLLMRKDNLNRLFIIKESHSVYYYHKASNDFKRIALPGMDMQKLVNFTIDSHYVLWLFRADGIFNGYSIKESPDGTISLEAVQPIEHSDGIIHSSHEGKLVYFIDGTYTLYELDLESGKKYYRYNLKDILLRKGKISSIIKHNSDYFIGFETNGLIRLKNITEKKENYELEEIEIKSGIFCLYNDRYQDIIWVGTDCQGVYLFFNDPYLIRSTTFNNVTYKVEKPIRALFLDKENTLWVGTKGDGILKVKDYNFDKALTNEKLEHITTTNSPLGDNSVYAFAESSRNLLWIGNDAGIDYYSYSEKKIKHLNSQGNNLKYIHAIYEFDDTTLYMASVGMGIFKATIGGTDKLPTLVKVEQVTLKNGNMDDNYFFTIYPENISSILFGNRGNGIIKMEPKTMQYTTVEFGKEINQQLLNDVFAITTDELGNIWCGTSLGLVKYTTDQKIHVFNERNGFPNNTIHGILEDSQNNLWLSTNQGMIKFNIERETFQTYNQFNGLNVTEFSDGAFFKDNINNTLFFGGINGFIAIRETNVTQKQYIPAIYFDNLTIFGEDYNIYDFLTKKKEQNILKLSHKQNFFSLSFKTNDYINGNNYSYYYKLDGVNEQWINNGASNVISFTNIVHGKYTLLIKFKNRITGIESPPFALIIRITPPWFASTAAIIFYALVVLLMVKPAYRLATIRHRKKREHMLERLKQKHQEEIYESKLQFFTNIAHEFCTPLTLIYGPCNRLLSYEKSDNFIKKYTQLIQQNADRLNDLIQELVEFRRIETGNRTPHIDKVPVGEVLTKISDSFVELAESKGINYVRRIKPGTSWETDQGFLTIIVTNLVSNAFKYVNGQGKITINAEIDDNGLSISVSNTGKGIKEKDIPHIFDRYRILDNFENQDNSSLSVRNGLGMAITNNLVKLLNGTIAVRSKPGEYTEFHVCLPETKTWAADEKNVAPLISRNKIEEPAISITAQEFDENRQTILIIDDELSILGFISDIFATKYNVITIDKPTDVETVLKQTYPDIILCDIMMPDIDGITLTKRIKANKKTAHIPIILLSAKHKVEDKINGLDAGAEMYITKPFNVDFLKASIERLILRKETLKDYFSSPISAFEMTKGKIEHKEDKQFVRKMHDIINSNLTNKDLSAQFIASELNMSTRHLYRKLEKLNADSPQNIIKENRLHVARNLLITTKLTIDEILYKAGFSNRSSFFKVFHEKYNCTPKEYRETNYKEIVGEDQTQPKQ